MSDNFRIVFSFCDVINSDIVQYTARHCMLTSSLVMSLLISYETLHVLFKSSCVYNSCSSLSLSLKLYFYVLI